MAEQGDREAGVRVLISEEEIRAKIIEMGKAITRDYRGSELTLVGVLKGSFLFMADLCRHIELPITCDFLGLSSYHGRTRTSGVIRITSDLNQPVGGKHVLVVEDIIDTGLTMEYLLQNLGTRRPMSIKVCSLLHKPERRQVETPIDYLGFTVPDVFVVGYGLDYQGRYRNLRYIGVMENAG
jgi:hypoxanthine phosphoribosyltransferase